MQPVDAALAKSFKDRFSPLVRCPRERSVLRRLTRVTGEKVTDAPEATKEFAGFVMWS
jgi:hypothetical protein